MNPFDIASSRPPVDAGSNNDRQDATSPVRKEYGGGSGRTFVGDSLGVGLGEAVSVGVTVGVGVGVGYDWGTSPGSDPGRTNNADPTGRSRPSEGVLITWLRTTIEVAPPPSNISAQSADR